MSEEALKENKMGVMPMPKLMLSMGLPMIISMIVQAFYNIVDSYFVSRITDDTVEHIGEYAVNALTLAYPVQLLIIAVGVGTGVGINALLSRSLGEKNFERAGKIAGNAIFIGLCTYIVFMLFGFFGTDAFLKTQTHDSLALKLGGEYLGICCVLSFGAVGSMIFEKLLQATGKTIHSTIAQLVGAIANIVLDPVLIFGLGPFPELGVKGAAYATVIGQVLTMVIGGVLHFVCNKEIPSGMRYFIPQRKMITNIYRIGIPAIIIQALMSVMTYGLNVILNRIGQSAVTAYGIYYKIQQFVFFASFGMNNTIIPVVSYNYGKGDKARVRSGIKYGMLYTLGLMLLGIIGLQLFASQICHVFSLSADTEIFATYAIRIITLGYLFAGANIAYQGIFQSLDHGIASLVLSLIRLLVIPLPAAYLLTLTSSAGKIVWAAVPFGELVGTVAAIVIMGRIKREIKLKD